MASGRKGNYENIPNCLFFIFFIDFILLQLDEQQCQTGSDSTKIECLSYQWPLLSKLYLLISANCLLAKMT